MKAGITFFDPCTMDVAQGATIEFSFGGISVGRNGTNGADGRDGADGKSAYRAAVDGGYTGTESEFNALLARIGISGNDGADGTDGKSAYQTAVEGGYTGTESEFNASLSGIGQISQIAAQVGNIDALLDAINGEEI